MPPKTTKTTSTPPLKKANVNQSNKEAVSESVSETVAEPNFCHLQKDKLLVSDKQLDFSKYLKRKNRLVTRSTTDSMYIIEEVKDSLFVSTNLHDGPAQESDIIDIVKS
ncbi:hypothetical protein P9112_010018 [Eukaryota sp. TZLM1-RC]